MHPMAEKRDAWRKWQKGGIEWQKRGVFRVFNRVEKVFFSSFTDIF